MNDAFVALLSAVANFGALCAMPFIIWMLAEVKRDVHAMKEVNLADLYKQLGMSQADCAVLHEQVKALQSRLATLLREND